jgi:hypothetical protein
METIAVTRIQAGVLLAAAKKRAKHTNVEGGYETYFKHVPGAVPSVTKTGSSCAGHQLVRVVRGLRKSAGITHKSMGRVKFKVHKAGDKNDENDENDDDGLAAQYPRGVACFMNVSRPAAPNPNQSKIASLQIKGRHLSRLRDEANHRYHHSPLKQDLRRLRAQRRLRKHDRAFIKATDLERLTLKLKIKTLLVEFLDADELLDDNNDKLAQHATATARSTQNLFGF